MKRYYLFTSLIILILTGSIAKSEYQLTQYKVNRIDSIKNIYVIYISDESNKKTKLVSLKENVKSGELIKVNSKYWFKLDVLFEKKDDLVTGAYFYDVPVHIEPDSILDIHIAKNVRGLRLQPGLY